MALDVETRDLATCLEPCGKVGLRLERGAINLSHQRQQLTILRHFALIHCGHRRRKLRANLVRMY